jgi:hypothetical protein
MAKKNKVKTEIIKTSSGNFECEVIELGELAEVSKDMLGRRATNEYSRLIQGNTVVYLNGKRAVVFLKKAMTTLLDVEPGSDTYNYWRWVSRDLYSSQRGIVGGKEFTTEIGRRFTNGQIQFFRLVAKGDFEKAIAALKDETFSQYFFYINKLEKTPYFDMEAIGELETKLRKKNIDPAEREQLVTERDKKRLEWFGRWFKDWEAAEDKVKFAADTYKDLASAQTYSNNIYSNVLGILDRSARNPFGRWTATTAKKLDKFKDQAPFYMQASQLYRETLPEEWEYIHNVMEKCEDTAYTLLDTQTFSTITINWNFPTYYHYDGKNNPRGVAVLTALTNESYDGEKFDGSYFVMPQLRLAFDIRKGDFFVGDNCNLMHGQTEQINKVDDVDNIIFVFYARDGMTKLDTFKNECCRKAFVQHSKENFAEKYQKNTGGRFMGIFPEMWVSEEWNEFKNELVKNPETGEMEPRCPDAKNTNYWYT